MNRLIAITVSFLLIANTAFALAWSDPCQAVVDAESNVEGTKIVAVEAALKTAEQPPCHQAEAEDPLTTEIEHHCEQLCLCPSFNFHQTSMLLSLSDPLVRVDQSSAFPVVFNELLSATPTPPFRPPRINS